MENNETKNIPVEELDQVTGGISKENCFIYVVKKGDCTSVIAKRYKTTVEAIVELNNLISPDLIYPNQKIWIPYVD